MAYCVEDSGTGESVADAIRMEESGDYSDRHVAEYGYISQRYGKMFEDWLLERQSLLQDDGNKYDLIEFLLKNGRRKELYFEVTKVVAAVE